MSGVDEGGIGPRPGGGYPVPEAPTYAGPTRERWMWTAIVVAVGLFIFGLMVFGSGGGIRPDLKQVAVGDILASSQLPADRFGTGEIRVVGWYAQVTAGCAGPTPGPAGGSAATWLQATCPVRVLLPTQPTGSVSQQDLMREGLRLAAPDGTPFPPPAGSGTAGLEQLVFVGHFDDASASSCSPDRVVQCRNTFVVSEYSGEIR